jgi:hypothetical protein
MFVRLCADPRLGRGLSNLECTADTEDAVVGLLSRKTLDGLLDVLALLGDQVIEPIGLLVCGSIGPHRERSPKNRDPGQIRHDCDRIQMTCHLSATIWPGQFPILVSMTRGRVVGGQELLESETSVAGGIGVPVGERSQPTLEPWALDDVTGERRGRHFESRVSQLTVR